MTDNKEESMLTTYNNPYNPFTNFDEWLAFDMQNGTDCSGLIARMYEVVRNEEKISNTKDVFVDDETQKVYVDKAIKKNLKMNPLTYLVVHPNDRRYTLPLEEFNKTIPVVDEQSE